ncbi:MAG: carboxypeptidase [Wolbachia endosymbiont of Fragariocoptes setiger]|nr:carboxypeptidase [Wolbachia endosymbiont of Fragariocoptes setiger]
MKSYEFLKKVSNQVRGIENILNLLNRSNLNIDDKGDQMGLLEEIKYEIISHNLVKESLADVLKKKSSVSPFHLRQIEKINKDYNAISLDLIKALSKAKIKCFNLWRISNCETNNLKRLKESFHELIKLTREIATAKSQKFKCSKYHSMLEVNITEEDIRRVFPQIGVFFNKNIDKIIEKQNKRKVINAQSISVEKQMKLGSVYLNCVGINMDEVNEYCNNLDSPLSYNESNFCEGLFSLLRCSSDIMIKKQNNFPVTPLINEMHGLFFERIIGTSKEFIEFIHTHSKEKFAMKGRGKAKFNDVENLCLLFNTVNLSSSLKTADEFTMLAHVMLRTKLEQDLIEGELEVDNLHEAWLEGMKHYKIPIRTRNEFETYFQDEYWVNGIIGYFPTKIIGIIIAVQIFLLIKKNHAEFLSAVAKGDFNLLINWLHENLYTSKSDISKILEETTGKNLDVECYTNYLFEKYDLSNE